MESDKEKEKEKVNGWHTSFPYAFYHFSTSGGAVAVATMFTHPLDVVKVRLQMQLVGQRGPLVGMCETFGKLIKVEGARGLYLGLAPALTRSTLYGGMRLGLYEPCKYLCDLMFGSTNVLVKIGSGAFSGAFATALTNPMEVLKIRLQMNSRRGLAREMHKIISEEGVRALWKGVGPAMTRASALTASQLATYDESKQALLRWTKLDEGFHLHLISSCVAGTVGTLVTAPVDMIKTRLMLQQDSRAVGSYRNVFHCAYQVILTEGVGALYKGGFTTFARLGPQTTITFLVCEKLREFAGMSAITKIRRKLEPNKTKVVPSVFWNVFGFRPWKQTLCKFMDKAAGMPCTGIWVEMKIPLHYSRCHIHHDMAPTWCLNGDTVFPMLISEL